MKKINIAIDGWSSCGKSTVARQLAKRLHYVFIDSGAMYRAITLYFIRNQVDIQQPESVAAALQQIQLGFQFDETTGNNSIILNGEPVERFIRELAVAEIVSEVAAIREVREFAVHQQQLIGKEKGVVMDGRDIGTAVFPDAELKIFMTASVEVRVQRRWEELKAKEPDITPEEVRANLSRRDHIDSTREVSPLRKADDAIILDNSNLDRETQLEMVLGWANEKMLSTSN